MSDKLEREIERYVRLYEQGNINYAYAVAALAELGCGDEDIAREIGLDPDTGEGPRARFIPIGV